jgi:hypothetical protein
MSRPVDMRAGADNAAENREERGATTLYWGARPDPGMSRRRGGSSQS